MKIAAATLSLFALTSLAAAPAALAQSSADAASVDTHFAFEDEFVEGDYESPLGDMLRLRSRGSRSSLVEPRPHFVAELLASVEKL